MITRETRGCRRGRRQNAHRKRKPPKSEQFKPLKNGNKLITNTIRLNAAIIHQKSRLSAAQCKPPARGDNDDKTKIDKKLE